MKECPRCSRCWNDDVELCPDDDTALESAFTGSTTLDGTYRIERRLGRGGMGVVYQAQHLGLHKTFAVKLIGSADQAFAARFRIEAETLGQLKHPNIVDVTDYGIDARGGGLPYLAMEYLEGSTLADLCRQSGRLSVERALPMLESIAAAIDHAHARGVLHLDLKPANVFVCDGASGGPAIKILDFGLARFVGNPSVVATGTAGDGDVTDGPLLNDAVRLLQLGLTHEPLPEIDGHSRVHRGDRSESLGPLSGQRLFGTVPYMAPEVLRGQQATAASDIYGLGVLAYEILAGRPPFRGSATEIIAGDCSGVPPPVSTVNAALPSELDEALGPALARQPSGRPQHAADLVRQIRSALFRARVRRWRAKEVPRRTGLAVVSALLLPLAVAPVSQWDTFQQFEHRSVDTRFLALPQRAPDPRLIVVTLDEASLAADPTPLPDRADEVGRSLQRVFDAGARGVAIDLLLPEVWSRSRAFSDLILRHADALTLAAFSSPGGEVIGPECLNPLTASALGPRRASDLFGFVNVDDDADGVSRRARIDYIDRSGQPRDTWAQRAVSSLDVPKVGLGRGRNRRVWIDFSADWHRFGRVSWKDLAATLDRDPGLFRGRLVLVGAGFAGFGGDYHRVPVREEARQGVSGLILQALIVNTLLSQARVREAPSWVSFMSTALAVLAVVWTGLLSGRARTALLLSAVLAVTYVATAFLLFVHSHVLLPVVGPLLACSVAALVAIGLRTTAPAFPVPEMDRP